jgi:uncharacterized protein YjbI with pentapeptide repeats
MRPEYSPQLKRLALALALAVPVTVTWLFWSSTAGLLAAGVVVFVVLAGICLWVLPARLVARDTAAAELTPEQRATAVSSARTTLVQGLVGLAALAGIFVAWQQLQTDQEQSRTDRQQLKEQLTLTRQGQVAERFTRAIDQLGSDKLEQRLGGIYGLERIAKESPDGDTRLVVAEVLTAYVRQHAPRRPKLATHKTSEVESPAPDVQAVMTVLGRRTAEPTDPPLDLRNVNLNLVDLFGANLQSANLSGAQLQAADLRVAQLQDATLRGAQLRDANLLEAALQQADLTGARLEGAELFSAQLQAADLVGAQLQQASLYSAQLEAANLTHARLQKADLHKAVLIEADFRGAELQGADLSGAQLQKADFMAAQLQDATLEGAQLQGAYCSAMTRWPDGFDWRAAGVKLQQQPRIKVRLKDHP